ncbi:hypothetical protein ED716_15470 [Escherichia coli]|nr:hypothetical protein [Escherichia coli]
MLPAAGSPGYPSAPLLNLTRSVKYSDADRAEIQRQLDGGAMTYRVHTDTEDNPFSGGLFSQFGLSDTLY